MAGVADGMAGFAEGPLAEWQDLQRDVDRMTGLEEVC